MVVTFSLRACELDADVADEFSSNDGSICIRSNICRTFGTAKITKQKCTIENVERHSHILNRVYVRQYFSLALMFFRFSKSSVISICKSQVNGFPSILICSKWKFRSNAATLIVISKFLARSIIFKFGNSLKNNVCRWLNLDSFKSSS